MEASTSDRYCMGKARQSQNLTFGKKQIFFNYIRFYNDLTISQITVLNLALASNVPPTASVRGWARAKAAALALSKSSSESIKLSVVFPVSELFK